MNSQPQDFRFKWLEMSIIHQSTQIMMFKPYFPIVKALWWVSLSCNLPPQAISRLGIYICSGVLLPDWLSAVGDVATWRIHAQRLKSIVGRKLPLLSFPYPMLFNPCSTILNVAIRLIGSAGTTDLSFIIVQFIIVHYKQSYMSYIGLFDNLQACLHAYLQFKWILLLSSHHQYSKFSLLFVLVAGFGSKKRQPKRYGLGNSRFTLLKGGQSVNSELDHRALWLDWVGVS